MSTDREDYDVFLDTWKPGPALRHATLSPNLNDPLIFKRLLDDSSAEEAVIRTNYAPGTKVIEDPEMALRGFEFIRSNQHKWAEAFRDYAASCDVDEQKLDAFIRSFSTAWVDGKSRRQDSDAMLRIKASIRDHDREYHQDSSSYVKQPVANNIQAFFTPEEMRTIFEANAGLLEVHMSDYLEHLDAYGPGSINSLYVRRGVHMPKIEAMRYELHELSSYSLALGPVEQFAQTWTEATKETGMASIFSAPLPAIQTRVVAFSAFIKDMDLRQLELVVAPPIEPTPLKYNGVHGGIHEFEFE